MGLLPRNQVVIRQERSEDHGAIDAVNTAAFDQPDEARIVNAVRQAGGMSLSLVAEDDSGIVGHILFSRVTIVGLDGAAHDESAERGVVAAGLAPMAVVPARQRQGIGSALVRAGLEACADSSIDAVVVLGHPGFYPRFGFRPASFFGLRSEFPVPDDVFMAIELTPGSLNGRAGLVRYLPAFSLSPEV